MIDHPKKGSERTSKFKRAGTGLKKIMDLADGSDMTIDPELDRFSGEEFLPEKHKRDEKRLLNSSIPQQPSLK